MAPDNPTGTAETTAPPAGNLPPAAALAWLQWYVDVGVDTLANAAPVSWVEHRPASLTPPPSVTRPAAATPSQIQPTATTAQVGSMPLGTAEAVIAAQRLAAAANTLEELKQAMASFDGLSIVKTARNMVFADGVAGSPLMIVGEAPGREEDERGLPFVGQSGQLLDRILAAVGRDRTNTYISNIVNWRPPGNRNPTDGEIEICRPFITRHIELAKPSVLVLMGGTAGKALLPVKTGITRFRGQWFDFQPGAGAEPVPTLATFHPAFLLRSPERKREVWLDMLAVAARLPESTT
jgi:uracil-DNA glycosylase